MKMQRLRIQPIPPRTEKCGLCDKPKTCIAYDHDLRAAICDDCQLYVAHAEIQLRNAHLTIPTDSLLEGGTGV